MGVVEWFGGIERVLWLDLTQRNYWRMVASFFVCTNFYYYLYHLTSRKQWRKQSSVMNKGIGLYESFSVMSNYVFFIVLHLPLMRGEPRDSQLEAHKARKAEG